jgi:hydroxymethylpyrimidine pyrophosphatase-like HAD family hydrolase
MSGRRALLVSGRRLDDLLVVCPNIEVFDYVVAENGAVAYEPRTREEVVLGKAPPVEFLHQLQRLNVEFETGRVIVSTWLPHHTRVLHAIQETGLELVVIFNRTSVMVLPPGVNKGTGLEYALRKLGLSFHEVVGVGNAENDHSFLERCECAVAVANAEPTIRQLADFTTGGERGQGVAELIDQLVADDLARGEGNLSHHFITVGLHPDGTDVRLSPYGMNILIAGPSGTGKSTITAGIVEHLIKQSYQVCIIDPEGDYGTLDDVITLGNRKVAVGISEVLTILEDPKINLNLNLLGIPLAQRPEFFGQLFPSLRALRTRAGRPHWIILDEAHHLLPLEWGHLAEALPRKLGETIIITVHPEHLAPTVLSLVDAIIAVGPSPDKTLRSYCDAGGYAFIWPDGLSYRHGHAILWFPRSGNPPFSIGIIPPLGYRVRHRRKYAEGNLGDKSFHFRGPDGRHNLKAANLTTFALLAEGIDEETWLFHLHRGDYSQWFRDAVKDRYLADQTERIEQRASLQPVETRSLVCSLIEARYTLPE